MAAGAQVEFTDDPTWIVDPIGTDITSLIIGRNRHTQPPDRWNHQFRPRFSICGSIDWIDYTEGASCWRCLLSFDWWTLLCCKRIGCISEWNDPSTSIQTCTAARRSFAVSRGNRSRIWPISRSIWQEDDIYTFIIAEKAREQRYVFGTGSQRPLHRFCSDQHVLRRQRKRWCVLGSRLLGMGRCSCYSHRERVWRHCSHWQLQGWSSPSQHFQPQIYGYSSCNRRKQPAQDCSSNVGNYSRSGCS